MNKEELYSSLICALSHNLDACENCKKCEGNDCAEIRTNLIKELAMYMNTELPWNETTDE